MSQEKLNALNDEIDQLNKQRDMGLVTIWEYLNKMVDIRINHKPFSLDGLIDPPTGLPYPTAEEIAKIDKELGALDYPKDREPQTDECDLCGDASLDLNEISVKKRSGGSYPAYVCPRCSERAVSNDC